MPSVRPPALPAAVPWLRRVAVVVLVAGLVSSCAGSAEDGAADPPPGVTQAPVGPVTSAPPAEVLRTPLPGFGEVAIEVVKVDGQVVAWCLLLADTPELRQRGLMTVTDPELGGYDGMLFRFDADTESAFWMRNTPQPLSLAYVADDGSLVSTVEMEPCSDSPACPSYPPSGPYRRTIEVPTAVGGVEALGIEPGAIVRDLMTSCSDPDDT